MSVSTSGSSFWHNTRHAFSRRRVMEFLKTMLVVAPLTLLIWIYAERSQVKPDSAQISVVLAPANQALAPTEPIALSLDIIEGPPNQLARFKEELNQRSAAGQLRINLPQIYDAGDNPIDTKLLLNGDPVLGSYGVQITKVTPPILRVHIDKITWKTLTVSMPQTSDVPPNVQEVKFEPSTVNASGPESIMERDYPGNNPKIFIDITNLKQKFATPGSHTEPNVPVVLPRDGRFTIDKPRISVVKFDVSSDDAEVTVPSAFIAVQQPLAQQGKWQVKLSEQVIQNVKLRGPKTIVQKYERGEEPLTAVLRVSQDDIATGGGTDRKLEFVDLPSDVEVKSGPYSMNFSLEPIGR